MHVLMHEARVRRGLPTLESILLASHGVGVELAEPPTIFVDLGGVHLPLHLAVEGFNLRSGTNHVTEQKPASKPKIITILC